MKRVETFAEAKSQDTTSFVGVLKRRQYKPGQRCVQLVFETPEGIRLSLSRNSTLVRAMTVGKSYRIEGVERALGDKVYIEEPRAFALRYELKLSHRRRLKTFAAVAALVVVVGLSYLAFGGNDKVQLQTVSTSHHAAVTPVTDTTNVATAADTQPSTTPATPTTPTTPATSTPVKPKVVAPAVASPAPASTPTPTVPAVVPPVVPTQPDCDPATVIAFKPTTIADLSQPEGLITAGVDGQDQLCYPNGRDQPSVATHIDPVDEVTNVWP